MAVMRTRSWIALAGLGAFVIAACSSSDSPPAESPAPTQQAPAAAPTTGQPDTAAQVIIDELYVDSEAEPDEGEPPLTVKFVTTVEDHTGDVECEWDFGDGSPKVKGLSPTHVYKTEDDFIATVVCKDSKGITGETEVDVTVYKYE